MQLYGVVIVGAIKRATVKVGTRFAGLAADGKPFTTLSEGQSAGEFTVAEIQPSHLVLQAPGGQQIIRFTKKADRSAAIGGATPPPPVQSASVAPAPAPAPEGGAQTPAADAASAPLSAATQALAPTPSATTGGSATGSMQVVAPDVSGQAAATAGNTVPGGGLAAALAAARSKAAAQAQGSGQPNPIFGNPFNQKP